MTRVAVGALADLPDQAGVRVVSGDKAVAVFRRGGDVHAIADLCSHAEASLAQGAVFDGEVECPRHGAAFDITTGEALTLPATQAVDVFAVDIADGTVFVEIPEEDASE